MRRVFIICLSLLAVWFRMLFSPLFLEKGKVLELLGVGLGLLTILRSLPEACLRLKLEAAA